MHARLAAVCFGSVLYASGCLYRAMPTQGGGQVKATDGPRRIDAADIALPAGYRIEAMAQGLTYPTGIAFDANGTPHVVEAGYVYGEDFVAPRLLRIEASGPPTVVVQGKNGPWNGVAFHDGTFFVAEGGVSEGGRILRMDAQGNISVLVEGLPSFGDHHTNGPIVGADGYVYFAQGTATNSAVVGPDNAEFGWLKRHPRFHDVPCRDVVLEGVNFRSENSLAPGGAEAVTGAFLPFGTASQPKQRVAGRLPCTGAVLRVPMTGGPPELVAWGLRNPFGLAFSPDGQLYVTENAFDDRGSRPVFGSADALWRITPGTWYGWPDFSEGRPVFTERYEPPGKPLPPRLLAEHPNRPPAPVAYFAVHSSSNGFDFSKNPSFGYVGQAFVAQFGDQAPAVGKVVAPVGFKVVRVDVTSGLIRDFAVNRSEKNAPASLLAGGGLERPVAARFDPTGESLWVVDFGVLRMKDEQSKAERMTGVLWRIRPTGATP
jgi:glucose/arabinose dehydrogenase